MSTYTVGIGEWAVASGPDDVIRTFALGSCVAVIVVDAKLGIAGLIHIALPDSTIDPERARRTPGYFADTGLPLMIEEMKRLGTVRANVRVKLVGGAAVMDEARHFDIGKRNLLAVKRILWASSLGATGEDTGGSISRTVTVRARDGETTVSSGRRTWSV